MDHAIAPPTWRGLVAERLREDTEEAFMCDCCTTWQAAGAEAVARLRQVRGPAPSIRRVGSVQGAAPGDRGPADAAVQPAEALEHPVRFHPDHRRCRVTRAVTVAYVANRLAHRYGSAVPPIPQTSRGSRLHHARSQRRVACRPRPPRPWGLFQVARQIVANSRLKGQNSTQCPASPRSPASRYRARARPARTLFEFAFCVLSYVHDFRQLRDRGAVCLDCEEGHDAQQWSDVRVGDVCLSHSHGFLCRSVRARPRPTGLPTGRL